jgi:DNA invertase Pin-like site-specific DNA recombinase
MGGGARLQGRGTLRLPTGEHRPGFEEMIKFLGGGQADVLIARHHDRLTRNPDDFARLMQICGTAKIKISLYTGGELDLSTASGGFYGFMETAGCGR